MATTQQQAAQAYTAAIEAANELREARALYDRDLSTGSSVPLMDSPARRLVVRCRADLDGAKSALAAALDDLAVSL